MAGRTEYGHYSDPIQLITKAKTLEADWIDLTDSLVSGWHDVRSYSKATFGIDLTIGDSLDIRLRTRFRLSETGTVRDPQIKSKASNYVELKPEYFKVKNDPVLTSQEMVFSVDLDGIGWILVQAMAVTPGVSPGTIDKAEYVVTYNAS